MKAVAVRLGWTHDFNTFFSRAITYVTGQPSHMLIIFDMADGEPSQYYEALWGEGWTGPKPVDNLEKWAEEDGRKLIIEDTWITSDRAEYIHKKAQNLVGHASYGRGQIFFHWLFERFGQYTGIHIPKSDNKITCAEGAGFLIGEDIDLRTKQRERFDELSPAFCLSQFLNLKRKHNKTERETQDVRSIAKKVCGILAVLFMTVLYCGCSTTGSNEYKKDTTPTHNGEEWIGVK